MTAIPSAPARVDPEDVHGAILRGPTGVIFENRWIRIIERNDWLWASNCPHGGVAVLPIDPTGAILAVAVPRPAMGRISLEIPRGGRDAGEAAEAAARRELCEETELEMTGASFVDLGRLHPDAGVTDNELTLFAALLPAPLRASGFVSEEIAGLGIMPADRLDLWLSGSDPAFFTTDAISLAAVLRAHIRGLL